MEKEIVTAFTAFVSGIGQTHNGQQFLRKRNIFIETVTFPTFKVDWYVHCIWYHDRLCSCRAVLEGVILYNGDDFNKACETIYDYD